MRHLMILALACMAVSCRPKGQAERKEPAVCADDVYMNGKVYTGAGHGAFVEAFSIKGGKFLALGSSRDMLGQTCPSTRVYDLEGRTVLPGLIDSHAHLLSLGLDEQWLDLTSAASAEEAAAAAGDAAAKAAEGEWIVGWGWDQNLWPVQDFPDKAVLDKAAPKNPAFLVRVDGHALWVNSAALEEAGITADTADPEGGRIFRDAEGKPSGILLDNAVGLVKKAVPGPTREQKKKAIGRAMEICLASGLTMVHDAGIDGASFEIYRELLEAGELDLRVYAMIDHDADGAAALIKTGPVKGLKDRLWLRAVKLYADGALGSRGAALIEAYSDDPENRGILIMEREPLRKAVLEAVQAGFQPAVHAIGDRAAGTLLSVYEEALRANPGKDMRPRMEHAQVMTKDDIARLGKLGVIAAMQPIHCTSDMKWAESRLGKARAALAYAWRKVLDAGAVLASGSDAPVESPNPFWGIHAALTRRDRGGKPEGGWFPENRMTLHEAIESFTLAGARASFTESMIGTIEKGKLADFVVLDRDIFSVPAAGIHAVRPHLTVVGGAVAFKAP